MTDYSGLVERMRAYPANRLCVQVADALEAQAKEIAEKDARIAELEAVLEICVNALDFAQEYFSDVDVVAINDALEEARAALKGEK